MSKSYATRRKRPEDGGHGFAQRLFAPPRPQVVQAYSILKPQDVGMATSFTSQDIKRGRYSGAYRQNVMRPEEIRDPSGQSMVHFRTTSVETRTGDSEVKFGGLPELKVSENRKLAINNAAAQPKEFFAEPGEVTASNEALAKAGARVRLKTGAGSVKLPGNPTSLVKVEPGKPSVSPLAVGGIEKLVSLASDECNNVIKEVVGSSERVVVLAEHGYSLGDRSEIPTNRGDLPPNDQMMDYLVKNPGNPSAEGAREHEASFNWPEADPPNTAKAYRALPDVTRQRHAETLGLNEFAEPQVGEGYVIKSEYTPEFLAGTRAQLDPQQYLAAIQELKKIERGKDVTSQQQVVDENVRAMMDVWMVHYAGVVARDGGDSVTLENYNRTPENDWEVRRIFNNLFEDFADFRQHIADKEEAALNLNLDTRQAKDLIAEVHEVLRIAVEQGQVVDAKLRKAVQEAQASITTGLRNDAELANSMIHFQMYGQGDQSFHSAFKGMTSNPTTYRTRGSLKETVAQRIEGREGTYTRLLRQADLGPAAGILRGIGAEMVDTIAMFAARVRSGRDDDGALLIAAALLDDRTNIFADPRLAARLYRCYCTIAGVEPGQAPLNRAALVELIDVKLGQYFVGGETKTALRALKTLIGNLPERLTW